MPPRLRDVVALPDLGLTVLAGASALDQPVRWVAVSELEDPGPFLEGGELVLTTGMRLPTKAAACSAYVARLVAADAAALGLGVGLSHSEVPAALVTAAEARGLPLVRVPEQTPFIAVTKAISRLLAAEEYDEAARGFTAQRELIRAALTADDGGPAAVVTRLAKHVGGFALVLDPRAAWCTRARRPPWRARPTSPARWPGFGPRACWRRRWCRARTSTWCCSPSGCAAGRAGSSPSVRRGRCRRTTRPWSTSRSRCCRWHWPGRRDGRRPSAVCALPPYACCSTGMRSRCRSTSWGWTALRARPVRVVVARAVDADAAALAAAEERLVEVLPGSAVAAGLLPDDPAVVLAVVPAAALDTSAGLAASDDDLVRAAGVGDVADVDDPASLGRSLARARRALAAGADGLRRYDDLGGGLEALLDPAAADAWAAALLAPLDEPGERADLAATLHAWLGRHGQVDAAAADLGVHRHTVRHRLRRAEALLGRSLDDPGVRAELWLALTRTSA